ncbi:cyclase family protein [Microbacterium sp. C23T]
MTEDNTVTLSDVLGSNPPKNWGKWGAEDEVGSLNYLTEVEVLNGISSVRSGETFTLQVPIGSPDVDGEPVWPGRDSAVRTPVVDAGFFERGEVDTPQDGHFWADDKIEMFLQGSTQYDALGHVWYEDAIWNGYPAQSTEGRLEKASVMPIAERGVVGRGVLIDMARHRGKDVLDRGETFSHEDLLDAARAQDVEISKRDILLIRTGWIDSYYHRERAEFYEDFNEPGLVYSRELVEWFQEREIPNLVTDTIANETTYDPSTGVTMALHCSLMRNLGIAMTEICSLDPLADACARDGRWSFLYSAAPLKVWGASGAPVNPIVIR